MASAPSADGCLPIFRAPLPRRRHEKVSASFDEGALANADLQWPLVFSPPQLISLMLMVWIWVAAGETCRGLPLRWPCVRPTRTHARAQHTHARTTRTYAPDARTHTHAPHAHTTRTPPPHAHTTRTHHTHTPHAHTTRTHHTHTTGVASGELTPLRARVHRRPSLQGRSSSPTRTCGT